MKSALYSKLENMFVDNNGKPIEFDGDLIAYTGEGMFDVVVHGCNCFCRMKSGIAVQMAKAFGCDAFKMEHPIYRGNLNKLGTIDFEYRKYGLSDGVKIVNAYTQYNYGTDKRHLDYEALTLCLRKINMQFKDQIIGIPQIGCGLAGGDWNIVKSIIEKELVDMKVVIVKKT
jgi:O-acetyl-ADP-ribose deacetylase (regulator of RNase III)